MQDWWKKDAYKNIVGTFNLQMILNELAQKYKTNIIVSNIKQSATTINDIYAVEVWYNFNSHSYIINAYCIQRIDNITECEDVPEELTNEVSL